MHLLLELATVIIVLLTFLISKRGKEDGIFFQTCRLHPSLFGDKRELPRLLTAGFLHDDWVHFAYLMFGLLAFGWAFGDELPLYTFSLAYFGGIILGNWLSMYARQSYGNYQVFGASGGLSGWIFACLMVKPDLEISLFFFPISFPAWVFGSAIFLYSLFGFSQQRRPAYEMHIGGAIAGILTVILVHAEFWTVRPVALIGASALCLGTLVVYLSTYQRPRAVDFLEPVLVQAKINQLEMEETAPDREHELNTLLDEVMIKGLSSLSQAQRQRLDELSSEM